MRADRLVALLLLLQAKGRVTAAALADELEVSVRTVYRDLQALANAGVPVFAESGPCGGCQLLPGYRSPLDALTPDEADALLVLGVPRPLRELGLGGLIDSAQQRVSQAAAPRRPRPGPGALVHLDMPRWFHPVEDTPHLLALARAVRLARRTEIAYVSGANQRSRRHSIEPLGIVNKAGVWYVVAGTARGTTVFRVGRIREAVITDVDFIRPSSFGLEAFWSTWSSEFAASRPRLAVQVRAAPQAFRVLPEVLGDGVRPALETAGPPDDEAWRVLELTFEHVNAAAHRLIALGALIEVLSPVEVRDAMVEAAQQVLELYERHPHR